MMIAATFQPTSQGCCGDTVISGCHVVLFLKTQGTPSPRFPAVSPCGPCFSPASVSLLLCHQGAGLTWAESLEHLVQTRPSRLGLQGSEPPSPTPQ